MAVSPAAWMFMRTPSKESMDAMEKSKSDARNFVEFPRHFKMACNKLDKDWFVMPIERGCGGKIYAVNKKYPNVYIELVIEYLGPDSEWEAYASRI